MQAEKPRAPQIGPYLFGKTLGSGSVGKVKLAKNVETGELVAIKIIRKDYLNRKPAMREKLQREITVMKTCDHINVVKLYDVFEIETHLFLVIEYVDGCELFDYLVKKNGPLSEKEVSVFFRQLVFGLEYCHRRLICHRDLKPENLLLDRNLRLKIADFGMTNLNPPGSLLETSCGSPHYAAPEVVSGGSYDGLKADIWSLGVIFFAMASGMLPFDDDNVQRLLEKVQRGTYAVPKNVPDEIASLIKQMMTYNPKQRPSLDEIKRHPWFSKYQVPQEPIDHFEPIEEAILNPNMDVVENLVDLGWGSVDDILKMLAANEANLGKVFYTQLGSHPTFQNTVPEEEDLNNALDIQDRVDSLPISTVASTEKKTNPDAPKPENEVNPDNSTAPLASSSLVLNQSTAVEVETAKVEKMTISDTASSTAAAWYEVTVEKPKKSKGEKEKKKKDKKKEFFKEVQKSASSDPVENTSTDTSIPRSETSNKIVRQADMWKSTDQLTSRDQQATVSDESAIMANQKDQANQKSWFHSVKGFLAK